MGAGILLSKEQRSGGQEPLPESGGGGQVRQWGWSVSEASTGNPGWGIQPWPALPCCVTLGSRVLSGFPLVPSVE